MPAAAAVGMLDIVGIVGMLDIVGIVGIADIVGTVGIVPTLGGGGASAVPASGIEADGGGASPGAPALAIARAPAIKPPLPAREPAVLTGCEREGDVSELAGLHAPSAIAAIAPKRSPALTRLHSLICNPRPADAPD